MDLDEIVSGVPKSEPALPTDLKTISIVDSLRFVDQWYSSLSRKSRWMDLIGDYAGNEKFILDGDALLSVVLDDPLLALGRSRDPSFQIMHAKWSIEKFLKNLLDRSAVFDIVFWEENRHISIHTGSSEYETISRELARQVLFRHLCNLDIPVHVFYGLSDAKWTSYCNLTRPMFIMTTDGGLVDSDDSSELKLDRLLKQRLFIHDILAEGIAISLLNGIEFRDAKILSFILEDQRQQHRKAAFPNAIRRCRTLADETLHKARTNRHLPPAIAEKHDSDEKNSSKVLTDCLRDFSKVFLANPNVTADSTTLWLLESFLAHFLVLERLSLIQRAQKLPPLNSELTNFLLDTFLPSTFDSLVDVVSGRAWHLDIDTRIFAWVLYIQTRNHDLPLSDIVGEDIISIVQPILLEIVPSAGGSRKAALDFPVPASSETKTHRPVSSSGPAISVLPFHNDVLDAELSVIRVKVEDDKPAPRNRFFDYGELTPFVDDRHWHRDKPILPKHMGGENPRPIAEYLRKKALKRDQRFMARMQKHAETLTGAIGAPLQRQVITPATRSVKGKEKEKPPHSQNVTSGKKAPKSKPLTKAEKMKLDIQAKKQAEDDQDSLIWWGERLDELKKLTSVSQQSAQANALLSNMRVWKSFWLLQELQLYIIHLELQKWIAHEQKSDAVRDKFTVTIIRLVKALYDRGNLLKVTRKHLGRVLHALGFSDYISSFESSGLNPDVDDSRRILGFNFTKLVRSSGDLVYDFMHIKEHPIHWQLRLFGEYMDRSMDSKPDSRVSFHPDAWQRDVLDCLDANKSVLVVAPTSAGKTFISFYAMEKVLRESDDGILVYVAPTKALVNQVAAEVYARFKKEMRSGTVWSIHTRDYRINDPQKCQILITVPEMFAIMLLSPPLAHSWTPRIKGIILDEIHTIGQQEGGAVWEQILLLAPCPVIGLSATIGHPELFDRWLSSVQQAHGFDHKFIHHPHRYSHLRKFMFVQSPKPLLFVGLEKSNTAEQQLCFIHPVAALAFGNPTMPPDFSLEARDTLSLYLSLKRMESVIPQSIHIPELDPVKFFGDRGFLKQKDILSYEAKLKEGLADLIALPDSASSNSPLQQLVSSVNDPTLNSMPNEDLNMPPSPQQFLDNLMGLLTALHSKGNLPALLFSFDRSACEKMAETILDELVAAEKTWKSQSKEWERKVNRWEEQRERRKDLQRAQEKSKAKRTTQDEARDQQEAASSHESTFDPNDPVEQFSFAGWNKYTKQELSEDIDELSWTSTPQWAKHALRRGLGVHHSGMNKGYRSLVESLFRRGFLTVLFCTGTLALGINAPTKTSVFCGDSPFLTALMYRQCAGRAGRRGFDLLGNVVFYGIPMDRIQRLLLSRLPSLTGNFPLTSTLCLRLLNLLHGSEVSEPKKSKNSSIAGFAVQSLKSITNLPQISFGSETGKEQLLHHLRFSIDYLRRAGLIDVTGKPLNLYAIAAHLYHTEPSNFALLALLSSGVLHKVCNDSSSGRAKLSLMLVLCHLFGRRYLHRAYASEDNIKMVRRQYPSLVVLPPLPVEARLALVKHNREILRVFSSYAELFASQYAESLGPDDILPLSGETCAASQQRTGVAPILADVLDGERIAVHSRSLFVANSGHDDVVNSVEELTRTCRRGLQLNEHAIPSLSQIISTAEPKANTKENDSPKLNAYLYDYFVHGQVNALVAANGIRRGDVWYALEDFNLTLATIRTALRQLLTVASEATSSDGGKAMEKFDDAGGITSDLEDDSGYATGTIGGESEGDATEEARPGSEFPRPPGIKDGDWRVYQIVDELANEFTEKFKKMWA